MKLNAYQLRSLRLAQEWRRTGFSIGTTLRASYKAYLYLFGMAALANGACWWAGMPEAAWLLDGIVLGAVLRDIRMLRIQARLWPVNVEITDWKRVEALIAANSEAPTAH